MVLAVASDIRFGEAVDAIKQATCLEEYYALLPTREGKVELKRVIRTYWKQIVENVEEVGGDFSPETKEGASGG